MSIDPERKDFIRRWLEPKDMKEVKISADGSILRTYADVTALLTRLIKKKTNFIQDARMLRESRGIKVTSAVTI